MVNRVPRSGAAGSGRPESGSGPDPELLAKVRALLERELPWTIQFAQKEVSLETLQNYSLGSLIVLKDVDPECLQLSIDGTPIAEGAVVRVGDKLALRLDRVLANREKIEALFALE